MDIPKSPSECDRHGHKLAGKSPATTLKGECIDNGKGIRRNFSDPPEEGITGDGKPMWNLILSNLCSGTYCTLICRDFLIKKTDCRVSPTIGFFMKTNNPASCKVADHQSV